MPHSRAWYYYIRMKGKHWRIGIVNEDGEAIDEAGLNIEVWHTSMPTEVVSINDELPISDEHVEGLLKGVVYELLMMNGNAKVPRDIMRQYKIDYEEMIKDARAQYYHQRDSPSRIAPIDVRHDRNLLTGGNFTRQS